MIFHSCKRFHILHYLYIWADLINDWSALYSSLLTKDHLNFTTCATIQSILKDNAINRVEKVYIPYLKEFLSIYLCICKNKNEDNNTHKIISLEPVTYIVYEVCKRVLE